MKVFKGELPTIDSHYGDPRGVAFDDDVIFIDGGGTQRLLVGAGVKVSEAYYEAVSAGLEEPAAPEETNDAGETTQPEEPKKITPKENKNGAPPKENK
ncbi:MAG TPA: hypothetical protein VNQ79_06670 [Blastocatellia bacterium]|nr:hypothetical protein [Blastocatellia bacterium]